MDTNGFMSDDDVKVELRKQKEDKERIGRLQGLLKSPGWSDFQDLMNVHINERAKRIFEPLLSDNLTLLQEHNKGAIYGLIWARDLPSVMITIADEARKSSDPATEELENE